MSNSFKDRFSRWLNVMRPTVVMLLAVALVLTLAAPFVSADPLLLIVAGGGGGAGYCCGTPGGPGQTATAGQSGFGPGGGAGGTLGSGGGGGTGYGGNYNGGGGAGWSGNGGNGLGTGPGIEGGSGDGGFSSPTFAGGLGGGDSAIPQYANGGFGGGGGGGWQGGGGGGGYSGGGGGDGVTAAGGGGGSYVSSLFTSTVLTGGDNGVADAGALPGSDGYVSIGAAIFTYTGGVVDYIVPTTGIYSIDVYGAQGGGGDEDSGGYGAFAAGNIFLTAGTNLDIVVGGAGSTGDFDGLFGGGGGGGSFVYESTAIPEPASIILFGTCLVGVVVRRYRNKK